MSINTNIYSSNIRDLEYNKFVEIVNDTNFPPVTSVIQSYDGNTTQTNIYNKKAVLTYDISTQNINASPFGDNATSDAFGRLRVGLPVTLLDAKLIYDKLPYVFDEVVNIGASTFARGDSCVNMQVSGDGGYVIRQTRARFNYQPGKSLFGAFTFVAAPQVNIVKRIGLFQSLTAAPYNVDDGMYLEINSHGPSFNIVKTLGTATGTTTIPQSAWNIDQLNGTGSSGINIDFTKAQIFAMDYEWLGVGRVRFGFYANGKLYYAHQQTHLNQLNNVYITSPNQPVRYEIRQTGAGSGSLKQICATVLDEGAQEEIGTSATAYTSAAITVQSNVMTPIIAVRVSPTYEDTVILLKNFYLYNTDNTRDIKYILYRNADTNKDLQYYPANSSQMQYALGSNTITVSGGFELMSGFAPRSQGTSASLEALDLAGLIGRFGANINGTPETLIIGGMGIGGTATILASVNTLQQS